MSNLIVKERRDASLIIRMCRPRERNRLSKEMIAALRTELLKAENQSEILNVIITGTDDAFCSGADIRLIREMLEDGSAKEFAEIGRELTAIIAGLPQQTIAAINGLCYGGGLDLSLACDRRIASPNATFCHPGVNRGFITPWGGTQRLSRLVGEAASLEMFLTGEPISAQKALQIGLVEMIADDLTQAALTS